MKNLTNCRADEVEDEEREYYESFNVDEEESNA